MLLCCLAAMIGIVLLDDATLKITSVAVRSGPTLAGTLHQSMRSPRSDSSASLSDNADWLGHNCSGSLNMSTGSGVVVETRVECRQPHNSLQRFGWPVRNHHGDASAESDSRWRAYRRPVQLQHALKAIGRSADASHEILEPVMESDRLGVVIRDGDVIIPHRLLNSAPMPGVRSGPRYVVYLCDSGLVCGGWGDRQHGVLSAYLISLVTDRTFGVDMSSPCALTSFFHPRIIDWRINSSHLVGLTSRHIYAVNDAIFRQVDIASRHLFVCVFLPGLCFAVWFEFMICCVVCG